MAMRLRRVLLWGGLLLVLGVVEAKAPDLQPADVTAKFDEIMQEHVAYKALTHELVKRVLQNYLSEVDPSRTYFLKDEIIEWDQPSAYMEQTVLKEYEAHDFTAFAKIDEQMVKAIDRRRTILNSLTPTELAVTVDPQKLKDLPWADSEAELRERLAAVRALQIKTLDKLDPENKQNAIDRVAKRRALMENDYLMADQAEKGKLRLARILQASASALDPHTEYLTPQEATQFLIQVQQRLVGIGAQLRDDTSHGFTVVQILDGGPAKKSGLLHVNDRVIAVDDEPVIGMDITEAVELIRGKEGTRVKLTVLRPAEIDGKTDLQKIDIEIVRDEVLLKEGRLETSWQPYGDGIIAHIHLFAFYQDPEGNSSAKDVTNALQNFKKEHRLNGVILDLRDNPGGVMPQAVDVTALFITKGIVVSVRDSDGQLQHLRDTEGNMLWDGPLLVLINKTSASASEIVAQTLQDYGRALIVGDDHSYGKGSFQTSTLDLSRSGKINPQGEYKVTRGLYYTVSGQSPQLHGVAADIVVPGILSKMEVGEKYSKFPLSAGEIDPHFVDDLSDIPSWQRNQVAFSYGRNLQQKLTRYTRFLDILRKNSQIRQADDKAYQDFIKQLTLTEVDHTKMEVYIGLDFQLAETYEIMKDLVLLSQ